MRYIDEQICARLPNEKQKQCRQMVDRNGRDLLNNIQQGMVENFRNLSTSSMEIFQEPSLLCTHFQLCLNDVFENTSPVEKVRCVKVEILLKNKFANLESITLVSYQ